MSARELLLIVRAQNQASGALRRLAGDLKGLSALEGLKRRGQSLQLARNELMLQRQRAANELRSIESGKRRIALQKAEQAASIATLQTNLRRSGVEKAMTLNQAAQLRNQAQQSRLERASAAKGLTSVRRNELSMQLQAAQLQAEALAAEEGRLAQKMEVANTAIARQQANLRELSAREAEAAQRTELLRSRIANYGDRLRLNSKEIEDNGRAMTRARWDRVSALGRTFQHTARIMEYGGLILGGSLALMAHNAAQFETSVTLAATQTRKAGQSFTVTAKNSQLLQRDIRELMTQFPATADDISKAAYDIYSSTDVNFKKGRQALKLFAQAAVAGQTDVQTATDAGIVVLNNFGNNVDRLPARLQRMFAAVRFGRMTFGDFAKSMSTIGPAARAANQSFDEMAGTFAFLTRHLDVAKARVGFARVLEVLASPKMLTGLHNAGIEIQNANHQLLPLHEIIGRIITRFPQLRRGGTDAMNFFKNIGGQQGTIQARRAFTFLVQFFDKAGKDGASYLDMLRKVKQDNNEFTQSLRAMEKTTGVRWGVFINQLKALALEIGASVVPALISMAGPLERLIHWWRNLDESSRNFIGRAATYTAAFLLIGGAVSFLAGSVIRLFSFLGRVAGLMTGFGLTVAAVALTVGVLTGHVSSLSDALTYLVDLGTGSTWGWIIMLGVGAGAALKLAGALKSVRTATVGMAAADAAAGGGGLLAGLARGGRGLGAGLSLTRDAIKSQGVMRGLAASVALIPGPIWAAAGGMAAIAAAALLWKHHAEETARIQDAINASLKTTQALAAIPAQRATQFGGLLGPMENIERAQIQIRQTKREIADLQKQLAQAPAASRAGIRDQIRNLQLDLYDLQKGVRQNLAKVNSDFDAFTASFNAQGRNLKTEADRNLRLDALIRLRNMMQTTRSGFRDTGIWTQQVQRLAHAIGFNLDSGLQGVSRQIEVTRQNLNTLTAGGQQGAERLRASFNRVVIGLSRMGEIPRVNAKALRDMFSVAAQKGRMLTIPEMKMLIKAEVDPKSIRNMPKVLQRQFKQAVQIRIDSGKWNAAAKTLASALPGGKKIVAQADTKKAQAAFNKLKTPIHKQVIVNPPPNLAGIGEAISAGIQAGMKPVHQSVIRDTIQAPMQKYLGIHSPSMWMAKNVGVPIMQGIIVGILSQRGELEKTAQITANIFGGSVLSNLDEKKKVTPALLTKDLAAQVAQYRKFNQALARLARRGAPKELIDQLAALGPEAADKIAMLSRMSDRELKRYVKLWKQAQAQIKASQRTTQEEMRAAQKEFMQSMVQSVQSMFDQIMQQQTDFFGQIFSNIDPALSGEGLKQAQEEYASQVADFQQQIADLNDQMIEVAKQKRDQLAQAFGPLFSGDWLASEEVQTKIDWGQKLGFNDLMKDLQSQLDKFNNWRRNLTQLATKVPPDLARALADLGPDAADKIEVLNNATGDQLAQYVALWRQSQGAIDDAAKSNVFTTQEIAERMNDIAVQMAAVVQKLGELKPPPSLSGDDIIKGVNDQIAKWEEYQATLQQLIDMGLPAEFVEQLAALGPDALPYLEAITKMTDAQLKALVAAWEKSHDLITKATINTLNRQLQLWFSYGVNIATQIVAGISSQSAALSDYFSQLITALLQNIQIPVPPKDVIPSGDDHKTQGNLPDDPWMPKTSSNNPAFRTSSTGGGSAGGTTINYNQTVNAVANESLSSTLDKASFRFRTQVPG